MCREVILRVALSRLPAALPEIHGQVLTDTTFPKKEKRGQIENTFRLYLERARCTITPSPALSPFALDTVEKVAVVF